MIDHRETFIAMQKWHETAADQMVRHKEALRVANTMQRHKRYKQVLGWLGYRLMVIGSFLQKRYGPISLGSVAETVETPREVVEARF
jgi:hypothetical protein